MQWNAALEGTLLCSFHCNSWIRDGFCCHEAVCMVIPKASHLSTSMAFSPNLYINIYLLFCHPIHVFPKVCSIMFQALSFVKSFYQAHFFPLCRLNFDKYVLPTNLSNSRHSLNTPRQKQSNSPNHSAYTTWGAWSDPNVKPEREFVGFPSDEKAPAVYGRSWVESYKLVNQHVARMRWIIIFIYTHIICIYRHTSLYSCICIYIIIYTYMCIYIYIRGFLIVGSCFWL